jgi:hypothetical protein
MAKGSASKFSLADMLALFASAAFGFVCFLGSNFSSLGNTTTSVIWAVAIAVVLFALAMIVKGAKRVVNVVPEIVFLVLLVVATAVSAYLQFSHFFTVWGQKAVVSEKLNTGIAQAEKMFEKYRNYVEEERVSPFERFLNRCVDTSAAARNNRPKECAALIKEGSGVSPAKQAEVEVNTLKKLLNSSDYEDSARIAWLQKMREAVEKWQPMDIVVIVKQVDQESKNWEATMVSSSKERIEKTENGVVAWKEDAEDFVPDDLKFSDVSSIFETRRAPSLLSIGLALLTLALLLLPYISTEPNPKRDLLKKTIRKGRFDIN